MASSRSGRLSTPLVERSGVVGTVFRFWQRSYATDYIGLALLEAAIRLMKLFVTPFHRMFSLDDLSKQYPYADVQRVSSQMNTIYAGVIPFAIIVVWALLLRPGLHQAHVTILGLFISILLAEAITDAIKNAVGRPRPDLIARCQPEKGTPLHSLVSIEVCTQTDQHKLQDGWKSFPSGHSSFAFSGLAYLALFFAGRMHLFRPRTGLAQVLIAMAPLLGAGMIAISRLEDYRHDVFDVTCGSLLGLSTAYFSYRRYYPSLTDSNCQEPYPNRGIVPPANGEGKISDEERQLRNAAEFSIGDDDDDDQAETYPLNDVRPQQSQSK